MKLYIAHVGYYDDEVGIYELHTNLFVVAQDISSAKIAIKSKEIFKNKKMHIDGMQEILNIDGYDVCLVRSEECKENKSFYHGDLKMI